MSKLLSFLILLHGFSLSQTGKAQDQKPDVWQPFKFFLGAWLGQESGQPGIGKCEREYQFILHGQFLHIRNKSIFEPQEKNPKGEIHEDWGIISFDQTRKKFVLRQFHIEGFVNTYLLDSLASDGKTLVFITENIENSPSGWRAKETYKILNNDEFYEIFELAAPDKEYEIYLEIHFKRKR